MPYNPGVVDISGQLYAQGMERGQQYLNKGINQFFRTQEEETSFEAKNKAMLAMITANKEQFGLKDDESLKQFLKGSTFESQRDKYARMGTLVENNIMMAKMAQGKAEVDSQNALRAAQVAQANAHARVFGAQANALQNSVSEPSMTEAEFQDFRAKNPTLTVSGNPVNGRYFNVKVTDKEGKPLTVTDVGDRIVYTDPLTGAIVKIQNKGAAPSVVPFGARVVNRNVPATLPSVPPLPVERGGINLEQFNSPPPSMAPDGLRSFMPRSVASRSVNASAGLGRQTNQPPVAASSSPVTTEPRISNIPGGPQDLAEKKKQAEETAAYDTSLNQSIVQIKAIDDALPLINKYTTGIVGSINPFQDRQTLESALKPIQALTAFQGLSALKKGGVSLGQIAAFEIDALQKIQGNISDLKQDPNVLKKNLEALKANSELIISLHNLREKLIVTGKTPVEIEKELRAFHAENRSDPNKIVAWKAIHPEDKSLPDNDILNKDYIFTAQKNGKTPVLHNVNGTLYRGPAPVTTQGKSPSEIQQQMGSPAPFVPPSVPVNASTFAVDKDYTSSGASFGEARRPITPMDPSEEYNSRRFRPSDSGTPSLTAFPPAPDAAISKEQSSKALPAPLTLSPETAKDMRKILDDYENTQRKQRGETPTFQITGSDGKKRTINLKDGEVADKIIAILTGNSPTDLRPELEIDREATRLRTDEIMRRELLLRQFQRLAPRGR